jgi:putative nucleotidyltransferase with HDIG domain
MDRATKLYITVVVLASAVLLAAHFPPTELISLDRREWGVVAAFILVGLLSQAAAIDFGKGRQASSSVAFVPFLTAAIVMPPTVSLLVVAVVIGVSEIAFTRREIVKATFNVAQVLLAIGIAANLYTVALGDRPRGEIFLPAFGVLVLAFFITNILLSSIGLSLYRGQPFMPTLRDVLGPRGGNFLGDLIASPLVFLVVGMSHNAWGVLALFLPVVFIRRFYLTERRLVEANTDLLTVLVKAIETRDPYTSGHSIRVSTLSTLIAEDMKLSWRRVAKTRKAALLHDIGKIDPVYADVLAKPFDLTDEERRLIQTHAARGADLLLDLNSVDAEIIATVRHHHERYDGHGYPAGLVGETIPLAARIIMMSDSIDAMLSDRPYRKALTVEEVKKELTRCSGTQFDPRIVECVIARGTLEKAVALVDEWRILSQSKEEAHTLLLNSYVPTGYS